MKANHFTMMARNSIKYSLKDTEANANIGFGCSGGADSLALLLGLSMLYRGERANLVHVVIVDHKLQEITSEISKDTATLVENFGFNAHVIPVTINSTNDGMESDARKARYGAFEKVIKEQNLQAFLIGHTKTDQAEQVFLGMFRGSGTRSLAGIRENREIYKRPFLNVLSRKDTQKVCEENGLEYWCDPHNDVLEYKRVSVRKMIQTVEEATGQDIVEPLVRTAQISAEDADALDFYSEIAFQKIEESDWDIDELSNIPTAVRKRIYRKKIIMLGARTDSVSFEITNRVDDFLVDWHGQKEICISNNVRVKRAGKNLIFSN